MQELETGVDEPIRRRRAELGEFLRNRRAAMQPSDLGMRPIGRRHVKGLRREEVATLAGIGVSWYTMLEQGRVARVTTRTLDAICDVFALNHRERAHVRALAAGSLDELATDFSAPSEPLLAFTRTYPLGGAFIHDALFDVVAYNEWCDGFFGFSSVERPNLLRLMVHSPALRERFIAPNWYDTLRRMVGHFRIRYAASGGPEHDALIAELRAASPEFDQLWRERPVTDPPTELCTVEHPLHGHIDVQVLALIPPASPTHTLILNNIVRP